MAASAALQLAGSTWALAEEAAMEQVEERQQEELQTESSRFAVRVGFPSVSGIVLA